MTRKVGIYIFDDVEVLDFAGPFEVFSVAARFPVDGEKPFDVSLISESGAPVTARGGLVVPPHFSLANHPGLDVLIVPGGVVTKELEKTAPIQWITKTFPKTELTASVCTGAFLLAKAGLLDGLDVTTHWEDQADLARDFPSLNVKADVNWVDEGKIVTSGGISAGIDMSLHLVRRLVGEKHARRTARQMEYDWRDNEGR